MNYSSTENLLLKACAMAKLGAWEYNVETGTLTQTDITREIHEIDPDRALSVEDAIHFYKPGNNRDTIQKLFAEAVGNGVPFEAELEIETAKGNDKWVKVFGTTQIEKGKVTRVFGKFQDITHFKKTEEALDSSESSFHSLVSSMDDLVFTLDREQRHTGVYGRELRRSGLSPRFFIGKTAAELMGSEQAEIHVKANNEALDGTPSTYQWSTGIGENERIFQTTVAPLVSADGSIRGLVGLARDITLLKRTEKEYQELFESSPLPQWVFDRETLQILEVNQAAINHYGYSREEFLSMTIKDMRPEEEVEELMQAHYLNKEQLGPKHFGIFTHMKKDGSIIRVEVSGHPHEFRGRPCKTVIINDITRLENMVNELKQTNLQLNDYKLALDASANVFVADLNGKIIEVNDQSCQISGYSREELLGQHTRINNSGYHNPEFFQELWKTISSGKIWRGDIRNKRKDGSYYWVDTTIVPMLDEVGKPHEYLGIRFDITDRIHHIAYIEAQNAQLREIAWTQSHMVRGPLTRIMALSNALDEEDLDSTDYKPLLNNLNEAITEMDSVIKQIVNKATGT